MDGLTVCRRMRAAPGAELPMFVAESPAAAMGIGAALDAVDRARVLDNDGPVDAGRRADRFTHAEAAPAVLGELNTPSQDQASAAGAEPESEDLRQCLHDLEALLEAGNTRALEHLP